MEGTMETLPCQVMPSLGLEGFRPDFAHPGAPHVTERTPGEMIVIRVVVCLLLRVNHINRHRLTIDAVTDPVAKRYPTVKTSSKAYLHERVCTPIHSRKVGDDNGSGSPPDMERCMSIIF